ncbi:putative exodeoxyribonuclease VIII [Ochrobactrum sp. CDB2]|nr:putative exodeoxyribonuclease VIII [Ochrobactrum sp. CDB2]
MSANLDLWEAHADIDPKYTKSITGKAYKGTSPNPQYVIKCLTEMFGPVGQGFGWEVLAEDFTPLGDEVLHWCRIRLWHTKREHYYEAYGQTKALMKTRDKGLMSDEDAPKKSLTDAIIKAASQLGIAANIFLGRWDDQKYVDELKEEFRQEDAANKGPSPVLGALLTNLVKQETHAASVEWKAKQDSEINALSDADFQTFKAAWIGHLKKFASQKEAA